MAFTYVPLTGTWNGQTGTVTVTPVYPMNCAGTTFNAHAVYTLKGGSVSFSLPATDSVGIEQPGLFHFELVITGGNSASFTTTIPKAQAGSGINIVTQLPWGVTPTFPFIQIGTIKLYSGSGAPTFSANSGDRYFRTDTPSTANQREYICTGGSSWTALSL